MSLERLAANLAAADSPAAVERARHQLDAAELNWLLTADPALLVKANDLTKGAIALRAAGHAVEL